MRVGFWKVQAVWQLHVFTLLFSNERTSGGELSTKLMGSSCGLPPGLWNLEACVSHPGLSTFMCGTFGSLGREAKGSAEYSKSWRETAVWANCFIKT